MSEKTTTENSTPREFRLVRIEKDVDRIVSTCNEMFVELRLESDDIEITKFDIQASSFSLRPYHAENTGSRPITEVKQHRAESVLGRVTTWEHSVPHGMISSVFKITFKNSFEQQWTKTKSSSSSSSSLCEHQEDRKLFEKGSVVVKFFPEKEEDLLFDILQAEINSIVAGIAYGERIAPKVLLAKKHSIVIEFVQGRISSAADDNDPAFCKALANILARYHALQVPNKRDTVLKAIVAVCDHWITQSVLDRIYKEEEEEGADIGTILKKNKCHNLLNENYGQELQFVKNAILSANYPVVFAHGDINHTNIMVTSGQDGANGNSQLDVRFIDLDLSGYQYRGRDFGSYFNECTQETEIAALSDIQMLQFIGHYIDECCQIYGNSFRANSQNSAQHLLKESKLFILFAFLFDINSDLWFSDIDLDKREQSLVSADKRFGRYLKAKKRFQQEQALPTGFN